MNVNSTTSVNTQSTSSTTSNDRSVLGKDGFLKLFMEQLKNQDPLEPMDNSQMLSQMAQFTSVEQLTYLGDTAENMLGFQTDLAGGLESLNQFMGSSSLASYSNLIGKQGTWFEGETEFSGEIQSVLLKDQQIYSLIDGKEVPINMLTKVEMGI